MEWSEILEMIIIAIIIVLIILLIVAIKGVIPNDYPKLNTSLDTANLRTGDILSVSYKNPFGVFVSFWSNGVWSHPGFIYKRSDTEIFVIEAAHYKRKGKKRWKGVFVIPLAEWLDFNKDQTIAITKMTGPKISNDEVEKAFSKISAYKLQKFTSSWIRLLKKEPYDPAKLKTNQYVCYEILILLLQELGIVKKLYGPAAQWPSDIAWGRLDCEDEYKYGEPRLLLHYNAENI
jgi:hypothetical protein